MYRRSRRIGLVAFLRGQARVQSLTASAEAAKTANDLLGTQDKEGRAVDYNRPFSLQSQVATQQDQLAAAQGDLAQSLIQTYRALGGGWEIRCAAPTRSSE